ncbi:MAG: hypothetical protein WBP16_12780 [Ferruginibacter sp.]
MELISYKTNIKNEKALLRVAPYLNRAVGSANWQLDLESPERKLTIFSPGLINEIHVEDAIHKAGFRALNLDEYYSIY